MAFDPAVTRTVALGGARMEVGVYTLSSSTVEVPTTLQTVEAVLVTYLEAPSASAALYVAETLPLVGANSITITDILGSSTAYKFSCVVIGY